MSRLRNREKGFTLIELLIVVAIIGIIAALLVPNFLDALQKAKQKRTMADERDWGTAAMSWLTDQVGAAAAGASSTVDLSAWTGADEGDLASLRSALVPQYIQSIPELDGWKHPYAYRLDIDNPLSERVILVMSAGRDGTDTAPEASGEVTVGSFAPTDYDQDIIWGDGYFISWPEGQGTGAAQP